MKWLEKAMALPLLGGALPGGGIVSAAFATGNYLADLILKVEINPWFDNKPANQQLRTIWIYQLNQRQLHTFTVETNYVLFDAVDIDWNGDADSTEQRRVGVL